MDGDISHINKVTTLHLLQLRLTGTHSRILEEDRAEDLSPRVLSVGQALQRGYTLPIWELLLENCDVTVLGVYWPIHHEIDLRAWMRRQADSGLEIALPVICGRNQALKYSRWRPQQAMRRGFWGIAEPAIDDWIEPQMVLAPLVGVDRLQYRLGNGGGYFDRSLAAAVPRPQAVGVGYDCTRIVTIYPQPHDVAMDFVITG